MFKLAVKNFRKIRKAKLDVDGLVWIKGDNNQGKSCLLKAIPTMMENTTGSSFITYGEDSTTVGLQLFPEGQDPIKVIWNKPAKGSGTYNLKIGERDVEELTKTGSSIPPELLELGFKVLTIKDTKYNLHFWPQGTYFLVRDVPSYIFLMVSRLLKHRNLIPMLKQMKDDSKEKQKQVVELSGQFKLMEKKVQVLEESLMLYANVDEHLTLCDEIKTSIIVLDNLLDIQRRTLATFNAYQECSQQLQSITTVVEQLGDISQLRDEIVGYRNLQKLADMWTQINVELQSIPKKILLWEPIDVTEIQSQIQQLNYLEGLATQYQDTEFQLSRLDKNILSFESVDISSVRDDIQQIVKLEQLQRKWVETDEALAEVESLIAQLVAEEEALDKDRKQLYIDYPNCPTCNRPWEGHERGHNE